MSNQPQFVPIKSVPQGRLALWLLIAGEFAIFGGLMICYLLYRLRYPEWAEQSKHLNTFLGALNMFVLLSGSYTGVRAHAAALNKQLDKVVMWMSISIGCGFIFLINKSIEYAHDFSEGFTMNSQKLQNAGDHIGSLFWSFYFIMTGLHATHVIIGIIIFSIILVQARKGQNLHRVELGVMYWHMVDIVWIFLFPLLYIAK